MTKKNSFEYINDLDAANKTIEVLKQKVKELYSSETRSLIQKQLYIAKRKAEENQARQTQAMKTILDHVQFGFLIVDRSMIVQKGVTQSCFELLNSQRVEGRPLAEILRLEKSSSSLLELAFDQIYEDILPESVTLSQLPGRVVIDDKILGLSASIIRNDDQVDKVMLSMNDVTLLEKTEVENHINQMLISILKSKDAFLEFVVSTKEQFKRLKGLTKEQGDFSIRRILHTIKGNSASFGMQAYSQLVHRIEANPGISFEDIEFIESELIKFLDTHYDVIEISYESLSDHYFEVSQGQMRHLESIISSISTSKEAQELKLWTSSITHKPASILLGPIGEFTRKLSERLGKDVNLQIKGTNLMVPAELMRPVFQNITHIIRNAIDHGIEKFEERKTAGKGKLGNLLIEIFQDKEFFFVDIIDDGKGIDLERIAEKALECNIVSEKRLQEMTDEEKIALIFIDGLSSAEITTDISGRGVGMASVKSVVEALDGTIEIETLRGKGTKFHISIPKPDYQNAAYDKAS